jgi:predicted nucleic acid-binding protein
MESAACRIEWTDADRFSRCVEFFRKHADQDWSFTDCLSFLMMRELELRDALTKDAHFEHAGFIALLG